jgi:signal transduction histidine kinase
MKRLKHSIIYKFNAIIAGMLLVNVIIGLIMAQTALQLVEDQMEKRGFELASYLGILSSNDILLDDRYTLFDRINKTRQNTDDVRYIIIADSLGRVITHTFNDSFPQGLPANITPSHLIASNTRGNYGGTTYHVIKYDSNEGLIREVILPIENGTIGYVRVGLSENITQQLMGQHVSQVIFFTMLAWIVAAGCATYLAFVIISPLRRLTQAAEQIGSGNLAVQAPVSSQDEVGKLSYVFNNMVKSLQDKQLENQQLLDELKTKEALRAELIMKLFTVQEEERRRISREIHDEAGQLLASLLAYMKLLLSKLTDDAHKNILLNARDVAMNALSGLRKIAVELRPPMLDDLGLPAAMKKCMQTFSEQHGIAVHFSLPDEKLELGGEISLALYRILQESLTNIAKHANAANVYVSLSVIAQQIQLIIKDDGVGMGTDLSAVYRSNRLGIYGMSERAELLGGNLQLNSGPGGTIIKIVLPITLR